VFIKRANRLLFSLQGAGLAVANTRRVPLLLICIKLTTVMGLTWILALIANWQQFLEYPSTVLSSLQGAFDSLFIKWAIVFHVVVKKMMATCCLKNIVVMAAHSAFFELKNCRTRQ